MALISFLLVAIMQFAPFGSTISTVVGAALVNKELPEAGDLIGSWQTTMQDENGATYQVVAIITDGYFSASGYSLVKNEFIMTHGGTWKLEGKEIVKTYEFDTANPDNVGQTESSTFAMNGNEITFPDSDSKWTRIDDGTPGALAGAWLITGRKRDGEISRRTPGVRKTMKILSGSRFQWIAYNTETREFSGSGGGTYTTVNGKYTENIEFFSRDSSRVGAVLEFDFELQDGEWHHSGLSSRGDPLYEIWTLRNDLEQ